MKTLSKTKFIAGRQCPKQLWYMAHASEQMLAPHPLLARAYKRGHTFGDKAKKLFPGGVEVDHSEYQKGLLQTQDLVEQRSCPIFEPGFSTNGLSARADVLIPVGESQWDLVEVKNSSVVKDVFIHDIAFQRNCYELSGISIRRCFVMHRDRSLRWPLFLTKMHRVDVTDRVDEASKELTAEIEACRDTLNAEICPNILPGEQCLKPYKCRMYAMCNPVPVSE